VAGKALDRKAKSRLIYKNKRAYIPSRLSSLTITRLQNLSNRISGLFTTPCIGVGLDSGPKTPTQFRINFRAQYGRPVPKPISSVELISKHLRLGSRCYRYQNGRNNELADRNYTSEMIISRRDATTWTMSFELLLPFKKSEACLLLRCGARDPLGVPKAFYG